MSLPNIHLDLNEFFEIAKLDDAVSVDTESTGLRVREYDYAIGISFSALVQGQYFSTYVPYRGHAVDDILATDEDKIVVSEFFKNYDGHITFFNALFDLASLRTLGINYKGKFYCTQVIWHLLNENKPYKKSLDGHADMYLDGDSKKNDDRFKALVTAYGWSKVPLEQMSIYAEYDAVLTRALWEKAKPGFESEDLHEVWEYKQKFIRVIDAMITRGIKVDVDFCNSYAKSGRYLLEELNETVGGNIGSPSFLKELLIDKLKLPVVKESSKTGKPSFDKYAMEIYEQTLERMDNPLAHRILEYRGWQKAVSSCYEPYVSLLSADGRLRTEYKLFGTVTGRMSSAGPNLQQIPRNSKNEWNGKVKKAFIAEDGYVLVEADFAQLELRLATAYANEESLKEVFQEGRDIFTEMSGPLEMERHDTKTFVYSVQYGAGLNRISTVFNVSMDHAQEIRQRYYDAYPGFRKMSQHAASVCKRKRKIKLWSGRYRHFERPSEEGHKAFNSVIQGGAADIVERTMIRLFDEVDCDDCRMLLQVHDSVVFEIKENRVDEFKEKIKTVMEDVQPDFGVVFKVDVHNWGE